MVSAIRAQTASPSRQLKKAIQEYESLRYISAIPLLNKALKEDPKNPVIKEMLANSFRNIKNYDQAIYWFKQLMLEPKLKPVNVLRYAELLANKEQYKQAEEWYWKYQEITFNQNLGETFAQAYKNIDQLKKERK